MKIISFRNLASCLSLVAIGIGGIGCGKSGSDASGGISIQAAFKDTKPEVKDFAKQAVAAEEKKDFGTAFVHYRALSLNPDLTPEQRNLANDSMLAMNKKLREASTNGDASAKSILEMYHANK
jgi:hypothetical protein